jgi:hypothetical protein
LKLLDAITDGYQGGGTPNQAIFLDTPDRLLESLHIGLIVPRFDFESDDGFGDGLGLVGFLRIIGCYTLGLHAFGFCVILFIRTKEIYFIVVFSGSGTRTYSRLSIRAQTGRIGLTSEGLSCLT